MALLKRRAHQLLRERPPPQRDVPALQDASLQSAKSPCPIATLYDRYKQ